MSCRCWTTWQTAGVARPHGDLRVGRAARQRQQAGGRVAGDGGGALGNKVTVTLNGQKVHDNATIQAITGGALDANETQPGPIMLQGDHGKVCTARSR